MKRFLLFFACAVMASSLAAAEALPGTVVFEPQAQQAPAASSISSEGELQLDFSILTPDSPAATPVAVDPIDKPTPTPAPTPNYIYEEYVNEQMGVSFYVPYTWLLNPNTNLETTVQFVEPKHEMMEPDGYQTRITIEKINMGLEQTASDARSQLESSLSALEQTFTSFTAGNIASASIGKANGYYCYYKAEYNDGYKDYVMNGRIIIVAHGKALYQVRITTPRAWYSYYEYVFRKVRASFEFQ